jgi:hypothetical protein
MLQYLGRDNGPMEHTRTIKILEDDAWSLG